MMNAAERIDNTHWVSAADLSVESACEFWFTRKVRVAVEQTIMVNPDCISFGFSEGKNGVQLVCSTLGELTKFTSWSG